MVDNASMTQQMPVPNLPLLRKVLDHIDAHPSEYNQHVWVSECGTAFCVAGTALVMTGHQLESMGQGLRRDVFLDGVVNEAELYLDSGQYEGIVPRVARNELGLTVREAAHLFDEDNTRAEVQTIAERIAARAGEVL